MSEQTAIELLCDLIECYLLNNGIPTKVSHGQSGIGFVRVFFRHAIIPPQNMIDGLLFTVKCRSIDTKSGMITLKWV